LMHEHCEGLVCIIFVRDMLKYAWSSLLLLLACHFFLLYSSHEERLIVQSLLGT
jgi:hypothetical protein